MIRSIVHITEKAGEYGGAEEYIDSITNLLSAKGVSSHIVYGDQYGRMPIQATSCVRIPSLAWRKSQQETASEVFSTITSLKPEVVYVHAIFDGRIIRKLDFPGRPYVLLWYIHDHYLTCLTELRAKRREPKVVCYAPLSANCLTEIRNNNCIKHFENRNYGKPDLDSRQYLLESTKNVDAIIVISNFMKEILVRNIPEIESKIRVVPRQIRGVSAPRKRSDTELVLYYAGRITPEKGLHIAISSLMHLDNKQRIVLRITGPIEDKSYWTHCVSLSEKVRNCRPNVTIEYLGFLTYAEVDRLYNEADLVLMPSLWGEPTGNVAAEGLKHGVAVVAFDVGGVSTWIRNDETGILVDPSKPGDFLVAVHKLASDRPYRERLAQAGQNLVNSEFTAIRHLDALLQVIDEFSKS